MLVRKAHAVQRLCGSNDASAGTQVVACEIEEFMRDFAQPYFERAGVSDKVTVTRSSVCPAHQPFTRKVYTLAEHCHRA